MKTAHLLTAAGDIPRAAATDVDSFSQTPVGNIVDALGRTAAMEHRIKPITRARRFAGSALPVDAGPRDNLAPWAALKLAKPGDVLVIATGMHMEHSVCGDLLIGMARNAGIVAIVTDGLARDVSGVDAVGIPVFAAGISPNSPQKNGPGSVGLPIVAGGCAIAPGDILCGDEDGVVVIPANRIAGAKSTLTAVREKEAKMEQAVRDGAPCPDWVDAALLEDLFTFVD